MSICLSICLSYIEPESDKVQFEEIYYAYRKQMVICAFEILKNKEDAEDVVQTVFVRIAERYWKTVRKIRNETDLRNYLLKAVKNTCYNMLKSSHRKSVPRERFAEEDFARIKVLRDDDFVELICRRMEGKQLVEALKSLDVIYRDVLYYHLILEMTVRETAKHLGRSEGAVKQQLVRGKKKLLHMLEQKGMTRNDKE